MNWKKWIFGALISLFFSALVAGAGIASGMQVRALVAVFCAACITHFGAWMKNHPIETISFDTDRLGKTNGQPAKDDYDPNKPPGDPTP